MKVISKRYLNLANLLTSMNLLFGCISIICSFSGKLDLAAYSLLFAMFCDFFDGFAARAFKTDGELGKQLDSLADVISFGMAPGAIMFVMIIVGIDLEALNPNRYGFSVCPINYEEFARFKISQWVDVMFYNPNDSIKMTSGCSIFIESNVYDASIKYLPFVALTIPMFSMFRLAKFNTDKNQSRGFIGLATPLMALVVLFFPLLFTTIIRDWLNQPEWAQMMFDCYSLSLIALLLSLLMILPIPLISLKFNTFSINKNLMKYLFLLTSLISILIFHIWSIPIILILYFIFSLGEQIFSKNEI